MNPSSADPASKLPSRAISIDRLIVMANQIAAFFAPYPDARRAEGVRNHLRTYWDPRMRQDLIDYVATGGEGLSPYVCDGVRLLTNGEDRKGYYGPPKS
jgi:formate dehydrogenase subunit delta